MYSLFTPVLASICPKISVNLFFSFKVLFNFCLKASRRSVIAAILELSRLSFYLERTHDTHTETDRLTWLTRSRELSRLSLGYLVQWVEKRRKLAMEQVSGSIIDKVEVCRYRVNSLQRFIFTRKIVYNQSPPFRSNPRQSRARIETYSTRRSYILFSVVCLFVYLSFCTVDSDRSFQSTTFNFRLNISGVTL